ncbi:DNA-binding Lrp family transcriptional regulator [Bacillus pakistanensis]|uniref:DNA-binding Lrp family transcriptional regulator n=1 Tax=Rossellomorea pakistanensis TaxID=992288 RepID=A0ABS2NEX1_9BACI|nr:HTH domain-containing protein [Bacillus pakistanensis]MBM7586106.1 DNA-binding Lrp family transcriptional regulator [Bacillus pakistanensis]
MDKNIMIGLNRMIYEYGQLLEMIEKEEYPDGVSYISQYELAKRINKSTRTVSKRLKYLEQYGAIKKINAGSYKVLSTNIENTPFKLVFLVIDHVQKDLMIKDNYEEQARRIGATIKEIRQSWGFIYAAMQRFKDRTEPME